MNEQTASLGATIIAAVELVGMLTFKIVLMFLSKLKNFIILLRIMLLNTRNYTQSTIKSINTPVI